ncbi:MAG: MFS transporter [Chloroflexi bacterium]|nr:MFS transporter [Chloroflexota bacterium]
MLNAARRPAFYYGWVVVGVFSVTIPIAYAGMYYAFGVLLKPIAEEFGWPRATVSGAFALSSIVMGLTGAAIGPLTDRRGTRLVVAAGSVLGGAGMIALAWTPNLLVFYLLWGPVLGVAAAATFYNPAYTAVANWFSARRGLALGVLTLMGGLSSPIFVPLTGWIVAGAGWRAACVVLGLALLATVPLSALLLRTRPEDMGLLPDGAAAPPAPAAINDAKPVMEAEAAPPMRSVLRSAPFLLLTAAFCLDAIANSAVLVQQVAHLGDRGVEPQTAAGVMGLVGGASLPGRFFLSTLGDRISRRWLLAAISLASAAGVGVLMTAGGDGSLLLYVAVYGLGYGAKSPLRAAVMAESFGRGRFGALFGIQGAAVSVAVAAGPALAGAIYDLAGSYDMAWRLVACAFVISAALMLAAPRPRAGQG